MAQGSIDPAAIAAWTDPEQGVFAVIDYAGTIDAAVTFISGGAVSYGTETSGSVTEKALPDGRAEVHVRLHTTNAWSFGVDFINGIVAFGNDPGATLGGAVPGLGNSYLHVKFINTGLGDPLPDLLLLAPEEFLFLQFVANAEGPLEDGAWGCLHTTQTGPLLMGVDFNDGFVAEFIDIIEGPCE